MKGLDEAKRVRRKIPITGGHLRIWRKKKTIAQRTVIIIKSKRNIFKNYPPWILPRKDFFT